MLLASCYHAAVTVPQGEQPIVLRVVQIHSSSTDGKWFSASHLSSSSLTFSRLHTDKSNTSPSVEGILSIVRISFFLGCKFAELCRKTGKPDGRWRFVRLHFQHVLLFTNHNWMCPHLFLPAHSPVLSLRSHSLCSAAKAVLTRDTCLVIMKIACVAA